MFGMSFTELLIIAVLALILLGPDKLPGAARSAGKLMRELRRATDDIKDQLETEMYADELRHRKATIQPVPAAKPGAALPEPAAGGAPAAEPERPTYDDPYRLATPQPDAAPPAPAAPEVPSPAPKA